MLKKLSFPDQRIQDPTWNELRNQQVKQEAISDSGKKRIIHRGPRRRPSEVDQNVYTADFYPLPENQQANDFRKPNSASFTHFCTFQMDLG